MKIIHHDKKHCLTIKRNGKHLYLFHRDQEFLHVEPNLEEIQVLKEMYNRIVDNHNSLENYFENN